jgi:ribosomal protein S16
MMGNILEMSVPTRVPPEPTADLVSPNRFAKPQELGWYDPIKKQSNLNAPAIKAWLAKGAQPSDTVGALLRKSLIIEKK